MNHRGNSIIEVMVVIIILTVGIVGAYGILESGQKLSTTSENRIKAINIAREGMEAVENIRDTNWLKFSSDYEHCWKVKDYDAGCIGVSGKEFSPGSYILVQSGTLWILSGTIAPLSIATAYSGYRNQFPVFLDSNGLTSSSGSTTKCSSSITVNCRTIYTREIQISHPDGDHMKVNSIVTWVDSSSSSPHSINLETILTNWKKKF
ncbi:MAG: prepilin-type N-terminal cleavage/methylation domain-containing protein [Candidatus Gracilibacteria bacterium]|nr:prepilin-type N-terminal cleavage/methylation domain-containing protein [Candidatus Gracilibacteria bacterium]